jgi:hypothetical protein
VDNTATLAIERVFLRDLPDLILSSCEPLSLSDEQLEAVAGESEKAKDQRTKPVHRIATLEAVVQACRQYKGIKKAMSSRTSTTPQKDTPGVKVTKD